MKPLLLCALAAASGFAVAQAQENRNQTYRCERAGDQRSVAVVYAAEGDTVCRVLYKKFAASPDPPQQLWHYGAHPEMCATQAETFLKKLEGLGLTCAPVKE